MSNSQCSVQLTKSSAVLNRIKLNNYMCFIDSSYRYIIPFDETQHTSRLCHWYLQFQIEVDIIVTVCISRSVIYHNLYLTQFILMITRPTKLLCSHHRHD